MLPFVNGDSRIDDRFKFIAWAFVNISGDWLARLKPDLGTGGVTDEVRLPAALVVLCMSV